MSLSGRYESVFEWDIWKCLWVEYMKVPLRGTYGNVFKGEHMEMSLSDTYVIMSI